MQSLNDHRKSPDMEANARVKVQSRQSVEHQSEALPVGEHENSEVDIGGSVAWQGNNSDDLKPCSQFPNLFSAGFCPSGRNENHPKFGIYIFHWLWRWGVAQYIYIRVCWIKSLFRRKWRWQRTTTGGGGREENLPVLFPAAVLACPLQTHQGHAQVWCRSDWTEKVLLCSHTLLFFCSSKANADMVVCKYCMKTFRNKNSLGCHIWRFHKRGKELITKERGYQVSKVQQQSYEQTERASHFQEPSSALPSLTFQTSGNNGNETE